MDLKWREMYKFMCIKRFSQVKCSKQFFLASSLLKDEAGGFVGGRTPFYESITLGDTHQTKKDPSPMRETDSAEIKGGKNKGADNPVNLNRIWVSSFLPFFFCLSQTDEGREEGSLSCSNLQQAPAVGVGVENLSGGGKRCCVNFQLLQWLQRKECFCWVYLTATGTSVFFKINNYKQVMKLRIRYCFCITDVKSNMQKFYKQYFYHIYNLYFQCTLRHVAVGK